MGGARQSNSTPVYDMCHLALCCPDVAEKPFLEDGNSTYRFIDTSQGAPPEVIDRTPDNTLPGHIRAMFQGGGLFCSRFCHAAL